MAASEAVPASTSVIRHKDVIWMSFGAVHLGRILAMNSCCSNHVTRSDSRQIKASCRCVLVKVLQDQLVSSWQCDSIFVKVTESAVYPGSTFHVVTTYHPRNGKLGVNRLKDYFTV